MKVVIRIEDGETFTVSVGKGKQTFKWLGLVVSQAVQRQRGAKTFRFVVPQRLDTARGALASTFGVNPTARIKDHVKDGGEVFVKLVEDPPLDATGAIDFSPWQDDAFKHDAASLHRRQRRIVSINRQQKVHTRMNKFRKAALGVGSSVVLERTLWAGEDTRASSADSFEKDWTEIQAPVLLRDPSEEEGLRALLQTHYQPIRDVFRWYSNIMGQTHSDSPDAFRMNHGEWNALVSDCRIVSARNFSTVNPNKVFLRALNGLITRPSLDAPICLPLSPREGMEHDKYQLNRVKFIDALCLLGGVVMCPRDSGFIDDLPKLTVDRLKEFIDLYILPRSVRVMGTSYVRQLLTSRKVAMQIVREMDLLQTMYRDYCCKLLLSKRKVDSGEPLTMSKQQFRLLLSDCHLYSLTGPLFSPKASDPFALPPINVVRRASLKLKAKLLPDAPVARPSTVMGIRPKRESSVLKPVVPVSVFGGASSGRELTERDVALCFLLSQVDDDRITDEELSKTGPDISLTFSEFVEALTRVALLKWEEVDIPPCEKLALAIDSLAVTQTMKTSGLSSITAIANVANAAHRREMPLAGAGGPRKEVCAVPEEAEHVGSARSCAGA